MLLRAAAGVTPHGAAVYELPISDVPMYNADIEARGDPAAIASLKLAITSADALLIATPEYNHGIPGVLKNVVDWISRPPFASVLTNKPIALIGASTGSGATLRARAQLREVLSVPNADLLEATVGVAGAYSVFEDGGRLVDATIERELRELMARLVARVHER